MPADSRPSSLSPRDFYLLSDPPVPHVHLPFRPLSRLLQMIPLDSFMAHSADGRLVPVVPGGQNISLTFTNRTEYVEKALDYRLHEMDSQVCRGGENNGMQIDFPTAAIKYTYL